MKFKGYVKEVPPIGRDKARWSWELYVIDDGSIVNGYAETAEEAVVAVEHEAEIIRIREDPAVVTWEFEL